MDVEAEGVGNMVQETEKIMASESRGRMERCASDMVGRWQLNESQVAVARSGTGARRGTVR